MTKWEKFSAEKKSQSLSSALTGAAELSLAVLDGIARGMEIYIAVAFTRKGRIRPIVSLEQAKTILARHDQRKVRERIQELQRQKKIRRRVRDGKIMFALTEKGSELLEKLRIKSVHPDGKQTVVSYDVPETCRRGRDAFRWYLKSVGFRRIHQSTWATDKDVADPIRAWVRANKLQKWVRVIVTESK